MITQTEENNNINPMPQDYLRSRRLLRFIPKPTFDSATRIPPPSVDLCDCCDPDKVFIMYALADTETSDPNKNDFLSILYSLPTDGVLTFTLQTFNGSSWQNVVVLSDPTYGTNYPAGIFPDVPELTGFIMQWRPVLTLHGPGFYRVKITGNNLDGDEDIDYTAYYCLREYNQYNADTTVKFQWNSNGYISNSDDDFELFNYGNSNWLEMVRLQGLFGYATDEDEILQVSEYEGDALKIKKVRHITNYKYKFVSGLYPFWVHQILKNIAFKSDSLNVTTYSRLDKHRYVVKEILKEPTGYKPKYDTSIYNKWVRVEVDFRDKFDDLGSRRYCNPDGNNCAPVTVTDSLGNFVTYVPSGSIYVIPQNAGTPVDELTCVQLNDPEEGLSLSQRQTILAVSALHTGQTVSYASEDDGATQLGRGVDFFTTRCVNPVTGTTDRFMDQLGLQLYADNIIVDWATGMMIYRIPFGTVANWAAAISGAAGQTTGGYTDWRVPNIRELTDLVYFGQNDAMNYVPLSIPASPYANLWSSTTGPNNTTEAFRNNPIDGRTVPLTKASGGVYYIIVRNFLFSDLGL